MRPALSVFAAFAVVTAGIGVSAQAKPDFSGKWTLVPDPNASAARGRGGPGLAGDLGLEFKVAQDEKTLTVTTVNPRTGEVKSVYNLDGSETKNPLTSNRGTTIVRVSKAKWNKSKLVLTTRTNYQGSAAETKQIWALDASGNLIVESTTSSYRATVSKADPDGLKNTIEAALAHERPMPGSVADDASTKTKATYRKY
jgi:hypothetical protein